MTLVQALLIALVAAAGQAAGDIGGNVMVNRPIVLAPLVGAILGDLQQGLIMGAALELIFLGVVSIGGATPSDSNMGSVLGTAFAMSMHQGVEIALALAVPIGILQQMVKYLVYFFRADGVHAQGRGIRRSGRFWEDHALPFRSLCAVCRAVRPDRVCFAAVWSWSDAGAGRKKSRRSIITGLGAASQMLPAVGFALLMNMLWHKPAVRLSVLRLHFISLSESADYRDCRHCGDDRDRHDRSGYQRIPHSADGGAAGCPK